MVGILQKHETGFGVRFSILASDSYFTVVIPTHPYQKVEGIEVGSIVRFDVERFYETGMERVIDVAVLEEKKKKKQKKNKNGKSNT